MYPPPHHQIQDRQKMIAVIQQYPLAMLVSTLNNTPFITHIPIIYNQDSGKLVAHIDKYNPQVTSLTDGASVTVVFRGPDCYISPSAYTTKQLPTWNYMIVHISGTIKLINDADEAKETMIDMTKFLEGNEQKFVLHKDNPSMERFVNYIQAFEINITNWEGKFKLSQDKNPQDHENAKQELIKKSGEDITGFIDSMYIK
ncbi:FMN-binding negative transcriptional regulator [Ulvibacter antarcticus]|uniref:PaiB family negative transcriptional regulator n=1 Tax=Ulvibacter antarcticus TaxID=442714 RepID=A0A3L9YRM2_9FLAO|nr:FMN-binding negative transcriptional regulator [Ulvibacter antarcticus]RMA57112.1 PaiB family negative transcriptional regulator [Ulvibacter antarcticus]